MELPHRRRWPTHEEALQARQPDSVLDKNAAVAGGLGKHAVGGGCWWLVAVGVVGDG